MGKRAPRHTDQTDSRRAKSLLIIGAQSEDALALTLRSAFRRARFVPDLNASDIHSTDLAVGIFASGDKPRPHELAARAHAAGVSLLCVHLRQKEALIGPLAIAGRA